MRTNLNEDVEGMGEEKEKFGDDVEVEVGNKRQREDDEFDS